MSEIDIPGDLPLDWDNDLHCPFYREFMKARALFEAQFPNGGYGVALVGRHAWANLADEHKPATLDILFTDYWMRVHDEEREMRLSRASRDGTSYITPSDPADLWLYIHEAKGDPEEIEVPRQQLMNVLCELELLQHRLAAIELGKAMDQANANDSGESK